MLLDKTFISLGRALAQLHNAAVSFQPGEPGLFLTWQDIWAVIGTLIEPADHAALNEFEQISAWVGDLSEDTQDFGLTHADFRAGNMLLHSGRITLVDFDEPVWRWSSADIARPFLELDDYPFADRRHALNWFVEGYLTIPPTG